MELNSNKDNGASKYVFATDLDYDFLDKKDLTIEELLKYISDNFFDSTKPTKPWNLNSIYELLKIICKIDKVEPSYEQLIYILSNKDKLLAEACAGAGKTTMSKYKMMLELLCYGKKGKNILAIAYNKHAAEDIKAKFSRTVREYNRIVRDKGIAKLFNKKYGCDIIIDDNISCKTFHSFCKTWIDEYCRIIDKEQFRILEDSEEHSFMQRALNSFLKKHSNPDLYHNDGTINALIQFYNWIRETLNEENFDAWSLCPAKNELGMFTNENIKDIIKRYKRVKFLGNFIDFQDMVSKFYDYLQNEEVRNRIRKLYQFILIDEYQDMTPSMLRLVKFIIEGNDTVEPAENNKLVCIGDGDQSIYGFRGADSDNCIRFKSDYKDGSIVAMSINRRCDAVILSYAQRIIESNSMRIKKPIRGLHDGGTVDIAYYLTDSDEVTQLIDDLRKIGTDKLKTTCVCYRNLLSSQLLAVRLLQEGIPFNPRSSVEPYSDILSRSIKDMLTLLEYPDNLIYAKKVIYKYVPKGAGVTKETINKVFDKHAEELKQSRRGNYIVPKKFWEHDYTQFFHINGFMQSINVLKNAHEALIHDVSMNVFMPQLINLLMNYFINSLRKTFMREKLSDVYVKFITTYFTRDISYSNFIKQQSELKDKLERNQQKGLVLTTMHGLKGLEFDNVFVIDMEDTLYPGNELSKGNLTDSQKLLVEAESRRLLYVTTTRAKHYLKLFFKQDCPSRYLKFFTSNNSLEELYDMSKAPIEEEFLNATNNSELFKTNDEFIMEDDLSEVSTIAPVQNNSLVDIEDDIEVLDDDMLSSAESDIEIIDDDMLADLVIDDGATLTSNSDEINTGATLTTEEDNGATLTTEEDKTSRTSIFNKDKIKLPWAEDEDNPNYKPTLGIMLDILRDLKGEDNK